MSEQQSPSILFWFAWLRNLQHGWNSPQETQPNTPTPMSLRSVFRKPFIGRSISTLVACFEAPCKFPSINGSKLLVCVQQKATKICGGELWEKSRLVKLFATGCTPAQPQCTIAAIFSTSVSGLWKPHRFIRKYPGFGFRGSPHSNYLGAKDILFHIFGKLELLQCGNTFLPPIFFQRRGLVTLCHSRQQVVSRLWCIQYIWMAECPRGACKCENHGCSERCGSCWSGYAPCCFCL